ncbi:hypothetical protein TWF730_005898 [Orbilia blumenaviensis]|uniref:CFEM domain-containing protein n=1 Tax=Orbilia blumenaviensis TaxID=1796055 RepID=A0AAV9VL35_9PEZI
MWSARSRSPSISFLYVLLLLTSILAQPPWKGGSGFGGISDCGQGCFFQGLQASGCQFPNIGCVCEAQSFIPDLTTCVNSRCNATEVEETLQAASSLCAFAGQTSSAPTLIPTSQPEPTSARTSQASTNAQTSLSTLTTSTTRSSTQPEDTFIVSTTSTTGSSTQSEDTPIASTTSSPQPPASETSPPSETPSTTQPASEAATPIGAIVGGVVGGFGGLTLVLAMVWLIMREKNKGESIKALPPLMPKPHTDQVEDQSQPIWDGQQAFNWNPRVQANTTAELPAAEIIQELPTGRFPN